MHVARSNLHHQQSCIYAKILFIRAKNILYILGEITEGRIKIGMKFKFRDKEFTINHIDFADGKENGDPYSLVALGITPNERSFFDSDLSGTNSIEIEVFSDDDRRIGT